MSAVWIDEPASTSNLKIERETHKLAEAPVPPGRPGDRRLQHDRGRRQGHGLRVGRQGQLRAARHPAQRCAQRAPVDFDLVAVNLDQKQPGFPEDVLPDYLTRPGRALPHRGAGHLLDRQARHSRGQDHCAACARGCAAASSTAWRTNWAPPRSRSAITATTSCETFFLNMFFGGRLKAMPPKLVSDDGRHIVIRPLAYVRREGPGPLARSTARSRSFPARCAAARRTCSASRSARCCANGSASTRAASRTCSARCRTSCPRTCSTARPSTSRD